MSTHVPQSVKQSDSIWSNAYYKIASFLTGKDESEVERSDIRQKRANELQDFRELGLANPETNAKEAIEGIIELGIKEVQLMDGFEPDLLILTEYQYRELFDIHAAESVDKAGFNVMGSRANKKPPISYTENDYTLDVVYSESADGMILVESDSL